MTEEELIKLRKDYDNGKFRRRILHRTPVDLYSDIAIYECGHRELEMRNRYSLSETHGTCLKCAKGLPPDSDLPVSAQTIQTLLEEKKPIQKRFAVVHRVFTAFFGSSWAVMVAAYIMVLASIAANVKMAMDKAPQIKVLEERVEALEKRLK